MSEVRPIIDGSPEAIYQYEVSEGERLLILDALQKHPLLQLGQIPASELGRYSLLQSLLIYIGG
jgi:hypothetical protein